MSGESLVVMTLRARSGLRDRKSTRLNSSHSQISYAVFCLKKKSEGVSPHPDSLHLRPVRIAEVAPRLCPPRRFHESRVGSAACPAARRGRPADRSGAELLL